MNFQNPNMFWFLLTIPLIILMYILKQKYEEKEISSLYLWNILLKETEVNTPWQRFKNNILFILQVLAVILLVIALAAPFITMKSNKNPHQVIVIDNSGSMSAIYEKGSTRLERAKELALNQLEKLAQGTEVTVITVASDTQISLLGSKEKDEIKKAIKEIKPTNAVGNMNDQKEAIFTIANQFTNNNVKIFTDEKIQLGDYKADLYGVYSDGENISLDNIYINNEGQKKNITVKVTNRSIKIQQILIDLFTSKDRLLAIKETTLNPMESKNVFFEDIKYDGQWLYAQLESEDILNEDNQIYGICQENKKKSVLLLTEGNIFLEKVLKAVGDREIHISNQEELIEDRYDLYILDNMMPQKLPQQGNIIAISADKSYDEFTIGEEKEGGYVTIQKNNLTRYMDKAQFAVAKYNPIQSTLLDTLCKMGDDTVIAAGNIAGRKIAVLGFELHNSDFVLDISYPIFMNNIMEYMLGREETLVTGYHTGETITINPMNEINALSVTTPNNKQNNIEIHYPETFYYNTQQTGVYKIIQTQNNTQIEKYIAVNYPSTKEQVKQNDEKALSHTESQSTITDENKQQIKVDQNIQPFIIVLCLFIVIYEWRQYVKG